MNTTIIAAFLLWIAALTSAVHDVTADTWWCYTIDQSVDWKCYPEDAPTNQIPAYVGPESGIQLALDLSSQR